MRPIMNLTKALWQGMLFIVCGLIADIAAAQVVVIVSANSQITALRTDQVANIFLGKSMTYPTGDEAIPLDQNENASVRKEFYDKVMRRPPAFLKAHWSKLLFTGKGQPPRNMENNEAMKKAVARNAKFIGYIDKSAVDESVRVVLVPE